MNLELFINIFSVFFKMLGVFYHSGFAAVIKFLLGVYTLVLFVDIVLLLSLRSIKGDVIVGLKGAMAPTESKEKTLKKWAAMMARLNTENPLQYKAAILEADSFVDEILERIGYVGENMTERLASATSAQIENIEELKGAHEIRNRIIQETAYVIDKEKAGEIMAVYEDFLKEIGVL